MISTNNKTRNENPASTGSLAGSKRVFSTFYLSSTRTNQRTCCINLDMSLLMQQVRDQVFDRKSRKHVESMSQTRTNLPKTWLQTWSKTMFAARFAAG